MAVVLGLVLDVLVYFARPIKSTPPEVENGDKLQLG
jgi:hypothetical protein